MTPRLVVLVLLFITPVQAAELISAQALNTGAIPCAYQRHLEWPNPESGPIYVRKVMMWHGMYRNTFGDVSTFIFRASDGMLFAQFGQDRYANPSGGHDKTVDFGDHYILIPQGDAISSHYWCGWHTSGAVSHHVVQVWYSLEP